MYHVDSSARHAQERKMCVQGGQTFHLACSKTDSRRAPEDKRDDIKINGCLTLYSLPYGHYKLEKIEC